MNVRHRFYGFLCSLAVALTWVGLGAISNAQYGMPQTTPSPYQAGTQVYVPYTPASAPVMVGTPQQQGDAILKRLLVANGIDPLKTPPFKLTDDNTINASTDGKTIVFTSKLWNTLTTTDQRAFVIAHELAHIQRHHIPKAIGREVGLSLLNRAVGSWLSKSPATVTTALASQVTQAGLVLADLRFSRSDEYDADNTGLLLMRQAGFSPQGAIETLQILEKVNPATQPGFLMNHPLNRQRMEALVRAMQGPTAIR